MKRTVLIVSALALFASCNNESSTTLDGGSAAETLVTISPSITRATELGFESGDEIGVSIVKTGDEAYVSNEMMSYDGSLFSSDLIWYSGSDVTSSIMAYYPYDAIGVPTSFSVKADQSSGDNYTLSDLMSVVADGVTPTAEATPLTFKHLLSSVVINITNEYGEAVSAVKLQGSIPTASVDLDAQSVVVDGTASASDITAYGVTSTIYTAVVVPQSVALTVEVETEDGELFSQALALATIASNKQYTINLTISQEGDITATFSGEIENWGDGGSLLLEGEDRFTMDHEDGFYITISTGSTTLVDGVTVEYYQGDNTLVVDGFKFNTAMPSGSTLVIDGLSESSEDDMTTVTGDCINIDYSVMGQPCNSDVTDLTCEIIGSESQLEFWIYYSDFNYPCTYNGEITVYEGSYATSDEPAFTMDHAEGFYITTSSGAVLLESASVTYYQGNEAIVIDGFSFSAALATTTLPIIGVTSSEESGMTTLTGDGITADYTFMNTATSGDVTALTCEIIGDEAQMEFSLSASMGGSGSASDYPCTYNGAITIDEGSYTAE